MLVPSGVTPPPIISAIEPVTTTAGRSGSSVAVRALHRAFGAGLPELFLAKPGDHDRQLMRRQRVGVVQHRGDRQVLAADRTVDDDLHALDRGEGVDRAPVAAGAIVVEDEHQITPPRLCALSPAASICSFVFLPECDIVLRRSSQTPAAWPSPTPPKNSFISSKRGLIAERSVDRPGPASPRRRRRTADAPKSDW